jgi:hypothetical protein
MSTSIAGIKTDVRPSIDLSFVETAAKPLKLRRPPGCGFRAGPNSADAIRAGCELTASAFDQRFL